MEKLNCWNVKKCGREPGGADEAKLGTCPASVEKRLDGVHDGLNAGRACWVIAGTLCGGATQGTFAKKYFDCHRCEFYKMVMKEEGSNFKISMELIQKIQ